MVGPCTVDFRIPYLIKVSFNLNIYEKGKLCLYQGVEYLSPDQETTPHGEAKDLHPS